MSTAVAPISHLIQFLKGKKLVAAPDPEDACAGLLGKGIETLCRVYLTRGQAVCLSLALFPSPNEYCLRYSSLVRKERHGNPFSPFKQPPAWAGDRDRDRKQDRNL